MWPDGGILVAELEVDDTTCGKPWISKLAMSLVMSLTACPVTGPVTCHVADPVACHVACHVARHVAEPVACHASQIAMLMYRFRLMDVQAPCYDMQSHDPRPAECTAAMNDYTRKCFI